MRVVPVSTIPVADVARVVEPYVKLAMEMPQYGAAAPLVSCGK